jgi:hypothetical protein
MKLKLPDSIRKRFQRYGKAGGMAGDRTKKSESAKTRWAKARKMKVEKP